MNVIFAIGASFAVMVATQNYWLGIASILGLAAICITIEQKRD